MSIEDIDDMKQRANNCIGCENKKACFDCENQVAMEEIIELCSYTQLLHNKVIEKILR